ncbi:Tyrosine/DOPA decarboxylase 5 [Hibiscus syriacus]|uniref:Tyrosine/DOPA decarboxylase 5 n=1 Tax=Hibiscus syriacus TaxID=106335 RepID=A0A6A3B283_HIBSY|nr:Tyrosine/DOPA decarboxylase 5 [Hibiscus syriacus]
MRKLLQLPSSFLFTGTGGGVLHGSTCEAAVCVFAVARDKALKELGGWENITKLVVYASDQTHFTFQKAAKLVGIPSSNFRFIETSFSTGFSTSPEKLRIAIDDDMKSDLVPLFLCATVGTTPTGAIDPIMELNKVAMEFKLWLHIDAAYAGVRAFVLSSAIIWMEHGLANLMYHIQSDIAMAKCFEAFVRKDERFEMVVPRKFALVCFRLKPKVEDDDEAMN